MRFGWNVLKFSGKMDSRINLTVANWKGRRFKENSRHVHNLIPTDFNGSTCFTSPVGECCERAPKTLERPQKSSQLHVPSQIQIDVFSGYPVYETIGEECCLTYPCWYISTALPSSAKRKNDSPECSTPKDQGIHFKRDH